MGHKDPSDDKFAPLAPEHPARRAFEEDTPYVHVCKAANGLLWAMEPKHVWSLAKSFYEEPIDPLGRPFVDGYGNTYTGREFLAKVDEYSEDDWVMKLGERFC